jgi:pimeloyl-ACP methyl ester carboxylesterase
MHTHLCDRSIRLPLPGILVTGVRVTGVKVPGIWVPGIWGLSGILTVLLTGSLALAQPNPQKAPKIPDPQDITLDAADGWKLDATYYEGLKGKAAIPFIMIHGWEGRRGEFDGLARGLQQYGHSTVTLDLRGHGGSVRYVTVTGDEKERLAEDLSRDDILRMANDVEAAKRFLMGKNNEEKCNIEQLCLVAADVGALVAANWAVYDWPPRRPLLDRGADPKFNVKAMVLLSPAQSFKGLTVQPALAHPIIRQEMSLIILAGNQDRKSYSDAKRIYSSLERFHPKPKDSDDYTLNNKLFFPVGEGDGLETSLKGTRLLQAPASLNVANYILKFIELRLTNHADKMDWRKRPATG